MPTAIVTGATGILGREIVKELGKDEQTWTTIWAMSRSKKESWPRTVKQHHLDLQGSPDDMAKELADVKPDYVFFAAYLAQDSEEAATKANGDMLENFLEALRITGATKSIKRVILTTGAKQYGVHFGAVKTPMQVDDPWLQGTKWPPNFYYRQQEILSRHATDQGWQWVVTYPNDVIGVARGNFMNLASTVGIYAAVTKELGQDLVFPGSPEFYMRFDSFTSSKLHAEFNVWAALSNSPRVPNQAFNVVNGDVESWNNMWPQLAAKFGMRVPERMFTEEEQNGIMDKETGSITKLMPEPPLADFASERGLVGSKWVKQSVVQQKIDLVKWSQRSDVKDAWQKLAKREGLDVDAFEQATWGFLGFVLGRAYDLVISMNKARKAGWNGHQDTFDSLSDCLDELARIRVLPRFSEKRPSVTRVHTDAHHLRSLRARGD